VRAKVRKGVWIYVRPRRRTYLLKYGAESPDRQTNSGAKTLAVPLSKRYSSPILVTERLARSYPGVQAVSPQVRPSVTFPAEKRHRPSAGTKLYCLVTEAHACEQLAQGCYLETDRPRFEPLGLRANVGVDNKLYSLHILHCSVLQCRCKHRTTLYS